MNDLSTFFSAVAKVPVHKMVEIKKEEFPMCHFVAGEFNIRWHHLTFNFSIYAVQVCIEDDTILLVH